MRTHMLCFAFAAMIAFASAANSENNGSSNDNQLPESLEQKVRNLRTDLEAKGYEVARGAWNLFRIEDCKFALETIGNCLGNNPAAPYLIPSVPLWPDEFVDQNLKDLIGPTPGDTWATF
ncbi:MAG: hypothetical protein LOY00_04715, partial [Methylocaldum sp.]|nr:hypothetical protein [Methylocaldum sp.]